MRVAIVHYHLGAGGVSQVIAAASRALAAAGVAHVILIGEEPMEAMADLPIRVVDGLGYGGILTADSLREAARSALGEAPDIWHFHNHSLGKNPAIPAIVARMAGDNERLVLQLHDLAEDGRPANYQQIPRKEHLYPYSDRIRYAFLNERDLNVFLHAGLPEETAGMLANPIRIPATDHGSESTAPLLFAPVRGIRRKNPGELVFLSAIAPPGARFAISRAPGDPDALAIHDSWRRFASRHALAVEFAVTDRIAPPGTNDASFEAWIARATHFATTSVAEGFGLPFLEAIAHAKPLIGRNLPHITRDHARHGIRTGNLYDQILIPLEWIDLTLLRDQLTTTLERNHRLYQRQLTRGIIEAAMDQLLDDGWLDFGNLPESLQQGVIERLTDPACRSTPVVNIGGERLNAARWLADAITNRTPTAVPGQLTAFSQEAYQKSLPALYSGLMDRAQSTVGHLPPRKILDAYLRPECFHFLQSALAPQPKRRHPFRAVIFDIYGTLLIAPAGGVKPDPDADRMLRGIIHQFGHTSPQSPSAELHAAVLRHHAAADVPYPEIDLRVLWREILSLEAGTETTALVIAIEDAWHPAMPMPGAEAVVRHLARGGVSLGLLSNAQCNTLHALGGIADLFAPELSILSYQHRIAKPSPRLFEMLADRLEGRGITPGETLFVGNDPLHDIVPAAALGFKTALFTGHPDSIRPGDCQADIVFTRWPDLMGAVSLNAR